MEKQQARRSSVSSIHSQGNSSIASAQCADTHTHAIIQRETDKKIMLVPLDSFINFGKVVKARETATYKLNKDSRKTERGKVLLFGTEELCVEQLQVLQEDAIDENQPPEMKHNSNPTETSTYVGKIGSSSTISNKNTNGHSYRKMQSKNKQKYMNMMNDLSKRKHHSQINENYDPVNTLSPMHIDTASSITVLPKRNERTVSQVKRKLFADDTDMNSKNTYSFDEESNDETKEHLPTTKKSKKILIENLSLEQISNINYKKTTSNIKSPSIVSSSPLQNQIVLDDANNDQDDSNENDTNETNNNIMNEQRPVSFKAYKKLKKENLMLQKQNISLESKLDFMKKNYVPMPDSHSRTWIINLARQLTQQIPANDIATHARLIGINNPNELLHCIQNRGTHTVREIVRCICTPEILLTKSGKTGVSKEKRDVIRNFVELQNGPIPDHQFNEAIDGVFRQEKFKIRQAQKLVKKAVQKSAEKKETNNGQQSIDAFYTKKSASYTQQRNKKMTDFSKSDSDEHF